MKKALALFALSTCCAAAAFAADSTVVNPEDIKWGDAPPVLPKGAKVAVLNGDPFKSGSYVLRLQMPANYRIPPHWHSNAENLTVISGTLNIGMGDTMKDARAHAIKRGGYHYLPAKTNHYAFTKGGTVVQVAGEGPFDINYLKVADDPTKKGAAKK
jgi:hypothetical protein